MDYSFHTRLDNPWQGRKTAWLDKLFPQEKCQPPSEQSVHVGWHLKALFHYY